MKEKNLGQISSRKLPNQVIHILGLCSSAVLCLQQQQLIPSLQTARDPSLPGEPVMDSLTRRTHYEILGVEALATEQEIKQAYREKLLSTHPDKTKQITSDNSIVDLKTAYTVLSNLETRRDYDEQLQQNFKKSGLISTGEGLDVVSLDDFEYTDDEFKKDCPRCTTHHGFILSEDDLENGTQDGVGGLEIILQCSSCSLWLKVQYYEAD